jgi:hypothetical protein
MPESSSAAKTHGSVVSGLEVRRLDAAVDVKPLKK